MREYERIIRGEEPRYIPTARNLARMFFSPTGMADFFDDMTDLGPEFTPRMSGHCHAAGRFLDVIKYLGYSSIVLDMLS